MRRCKRRRPTQKTEYMSSENLVDVTEATFQAEVEESSVPVLVDFWGDGCGPCMMMDPVLKEIASENPDTLKVAKINVGQNMGLAGKYGVRAVPTLLFVKDGEVKDTHTGALPKAALLQKIGALA